MLRVCLLGQQRGSIGVVGVAVGGVEESLASSSLLQLSALSASFDRDVVCDFSQVGMGVGVVTSVGELFSLLLSKTFIAASLHVGIGGIFRVGVGVSAGLESGSDRLRLSSLFLLLSRAASVVVVVSHWLSSLPLLKTAARASSQVGIVGPVFGVGVSGWGVGNGSICGATSVVGVWV